MKKFFVFALALLMTVSVAAKSAFAEERVALVSLQRALNEVEEGKRIKAKLKTDYDAKKKQIDALKLDLDKMSADIEKQKSILSQDALKQKTSELQTKFIDLQNKAATYEKELKTQEAESAKRIITALRDIVTGIAQKEGYTLVIENSGETVLYAKSATDITSSVISAYNSGKK